MAKVIVGKTSDIPEGKMSHATAGGKEILVANVQGSYYAINDICNHAGAELHEGELAGKGAHLPLAWCKMGCYNWKSNLVSSEIKRP